MKVLFLTKEYPPYVYGGAGIHVDYLSRYLSKFIQIEVRCFGDQLWQTDRLRVRGFDCKFHDLRCLKSLHPVFDALQQSLNFNAVGIHADIVHCHTWYSHFGGILAKINYNIPLVITIHSLERLRPWKSEQLGNGYDFTCWLEAIALKTADAVIAVSAETKQDILRLFGLSSQRIHVIYNGIDPDEYCPTLKKVDALESYGIVSSQPYVLFIGRMTRQKGIIYLIRAIRHFIPGFQVVICTNSPDTPEVEEEIRIAITTAQYHQRIIWIRQMLDVPSKVVLYSHAAVFICPSVYEPFGIINLEAMACGTAVVASAIGGVKEVVRDGDTGFLVPCRQRPDGSGLFDQEQFEFDLATRVNILMANSDLRQQMGAAGRLCAKRNFGWDAIARQTHSLYTTLIS